jgi:L-2-hydroxyglutarate oxidase LhgO
MVPPANAPELDVVVVGAGVVGLACAAAVAGRGRSVLVLEALDGIARETTSRNSEVIHAGIYYPAGSLKALLCTEGREALYARCRERGIPHRKLGKLIVASDSGELGALEDLQARGRANGVPGLEIVDAARVKRMEPRVRAEAALLSPETGIVDGHALCLSFLAEAEAAGAELLLCARLEGVEPTTGGYRLDVRGADGEIERVGCAAVVNAAGLVCDRVAAMAGVDVEAESLRLHYCKGDYFALSPGAPVKVERLVYPVPPKAGLGIHATLDLGGRIRFGPDAEFVDAPRYDVDPAKAADFAEAIRRYLPAIDASMLVPDYAGVRPRLTAPGEPPRDFVVREAGHLGLPGWIDCIGIESPGLTASPAIGRRVAELLASL